MITERESTASHEAEQVKHSHDENILETFSDFLQKFWTQQTASITCGLDSFSFFIFNEKTTIWLISRVCGCIDANSDQDVYVNGDKSSAPVRSPARLSYLF